MIKKNSLILVVSVVLLALIVSGTLIYGGYKQSVIPDVPTIKKLLTDSTINYDRVQALELVLKTQCDTIPKCGNEDIVVMLGSNELLKYNPPDCNGMNEVEPIIKEYVDDDAIVIDGSLLRGSFPVVSGGCNPSKLSNVKAVERVECETDNDCAFTKTSQLIRTSTGTCRQNRCFYGVLVEEPKTLDSQESVSTKVQEKVGTGSNKGTFLVVTALILFIIVLLLIRKLRK